MVKIVLSEAMKRRTGRNVINLDAERARRASASMPKGWEDSVESKWLKRQRGVDAETIRLIERLKDV